eukprot:TRINITY_DN5576_c0_g3_i1.p1 TRINITY_DN5576_c0_g3~~TRINITY_DN5576_c0_g3_i1.p1  ORF type:complete len:410 (+),score=24.29 TRINITY_DN5576_c0_g3_i1:52-1230(+)
MVVADWIALISVLATLPGVVLQWPCASGCAPWLIRSAFFCVSLAMACLLATRDEIWRERFSRAAMWANSVLHALIAAQWCFGSITWLLCFLPMLVAKFFCMRILLGRGTAQPYWTTAVSGPLAYYIGHMQADVMLELSTELYKPFLQIASASSSLLVTGIAVLSHYNVFLSRGRSPQADSASWLPIAIGRSSPIVPDEMADMQSANRDVQAEEHNVGQHERKHFQDASAPVSRAPKDQLQLLEAMRERSLARDEPVARAVVAWLDTHNPRTQIEALPQDQQEASLRRWLKHFHRDAPFHLYAVSRRRRSINEILSRMLRLKRNHEDWKHTRNLSKRDAFHLGLLAQTHLEGRPLEIIAACLQQDTDVWSTGSVTQSWAGVRRMSSLFQQGYA